MTKTLTLTTTISQSHTHLESSASTVRDKQLTLASQRIVDPSTEQDASSFPLGEKSTWLTPYRWPSIGELSDSSKRHSSLRTHRRTILSLYIRHACLFKFPDLSHPLTVWFVCLFVLWHDSPQWTRASSFTRFLDHTQGHTTVGRTPPGERAARHRDLYMTIHNTHNSQTSMPPVGFKPTISTGERPQTYALDRAATGTGTYCQVEHKFLCTVFSTETCY